MTWIEMAAAQRPSMAPEGVQPPENANDWYRIENNADSADTTDVFVYDSIGGWFGMYADDFIRDLKAVTTPKINLRINSPGGSVFDGVAIANAIRTHPANVTVYVDGLAASIASVIALAGDRLVMMPQTTFMIHDASGGCRGNAAEMLKMAGILDKQSDNIAAAYAAIAGGTTAEWRDRMREETWYTAEEAVEAGLADEVMPLLPKKEEEAAPAAVAPRMQTTWDLSMYKYPGREAAPAPIAPAPQPHLAVAGSTLTSGMVNGITAHSAGGVVPGSPVNVELQPGELVASPGAISNMSQDDLIELIRNTVRTEVADLISPEAPEPTPGQPETADPAPEEPAEAEATAAPDPPEAEPPAEEPTNESDDWETLVALLVSPTSSGADDVFSQLKEGW